MKSKNSELVELEGMTGILGWGSAKFCASCKLKMVSTFLKGCFLKEKKKKEKYGRDYVSSAKIILFLSSLLQKNFQNPFSKGNKEQEVIRAQNENVDYSMGTVSTEPEG